MRNLKRALSLTLASVMLLGMMIVGTSAASYPDVTEEDNIEAIEVLQAVQVMRGDDNGNFRPDDSVSRAEMAVVMALLLDLDYQYYEATCPFTDVPNWARSYVGACYANGIVSGYNATTYGANDTVNAVQAASMMMRALGYFQYPSDYADGFETATVRQASKIRLFDGINADARTALTRDQVARLALNALKTPIVEAEDNTINITSSTGDATITATGGQVNYVVTASRQAYARAIDDAETSGTGLNKVSGYIVELGEKLYNGDLKLDEGRTDDFGRPARRWEYDGKQIGLYAKKELMVKEYVGKVTGKDLYDLLGSATIRDYNYNLAIDGVTSKTVNKSIFGTEYIDKNNKDSVGGTGTGVLTQVFVDNGNKSVNKKGEIYIAVINTYLARATKDFDTKKDELTVNIYGVTKSSNEYVKDNTKSVSSVKLDAEDLPVVTGMKNEDALLVTLAKGEVKTAVSAEVLSGVNITSFKKGSNITVDGTKYEYASTANYKDGNLDSYTGSGAVNLKDLTYNVYLDAYGNLIGVEEIDAVKNYVFITGIDTAGSNITNTTAKARGLFIDGTSAVLEYDTGKSTKGLSDSALVNSPANKSQEGEKKILQKREGEKGYKKIEARQGLKK